MIALSSLCLASSAQLRADDRALLFDSAGYRIDAFRAPVPAKVQGAKTLDTEGLRRLLTARPDATVLIDVLPAPPRPPRLANGTLWLPTPHQSLPAANWLPNVGYGRLSDALEHYFRSNLERLTDADKHRAVVIFCQADCWMSWNAARRAAAYGYSSVYWYPDGTTGWVGAGHPLEPNQPVAMD